MHEPLAATADMAVLLAELHETSPSDVIEKRQALELIAQSFEIF